MRTPLLRGLFIALVCAPAVHSADGKLLWLDDPK
jgi:hypothetical protein